MTQSTHCPDTQMDRVSEGGASFSDDAVMVNNVGEAQLKDMVDRPIMLDTDELVYATRYRPRSWLTTLLSKAVPHGGTLSNAYNLGAVTLGSGVIALPSTFQATGVATSVIVLIAITMSTVYSVYIMMQAADKTGRRLYSYEALARGLLGRGWDYLAAFHLWMFCFGSCVSYVISTGDLLSRATDDPSVNSFVRSVWGNRVLVIIIWSCVMLPLSIPKEINSLRYFSVVGVSCMMNFVAVIVIHSAMNGFKNGRPIHQPHMFKTGNNAIVGFSSILFAFLAQTNVFEVARETPNPTPGRISKDLAISQVVCCALYVLAGVFGYLEFGEQIADSILLYYNVRSDVLVAIAYVGIGVKMCVGFAICMQPSRDAVYYCLGLALLDVQGHPDGAVLAERCDLHWALRACACAGAVHPERERRVWACGQLLRRVPGVHLSSSVRHVRWQLGPAAGGLAPLRLDVLAADRRRGCCCFRHGCLYLRRGPLSSGEAAALVCVVRCVFASHVWKRWRIVWRRGKGAGGVVFGCGHRARGAYGRSPHASPPASLPLSLSTSPSACVPFFTFLCLRSLSWRHCCWQCSADLRLSVLHCVYSD
ncbi:amino_acid_transporter_-_putative [Leishmania infantum]|uniref:Amino_acid_transporter_-_putative n=1 Tax=Leishmania infantum TaxID=5671 RepID=A0A6L0XS66_LEIIN|nr:amino_acid_transporter_-_putative [Leishmania infantum]SUZ43054.1 amino_acid_transporter_-_putative [Leishmania infantum]